MEKLELGHLKKNFFISVGPAIFNILPPNIKAAEKLDQFKARLDPFLSTLPDLPPTHGYPSLNRNTIVEWVTGNYDFKRVIDTLADDKSVRRHPVIGPAVQPDRS